MEDGDREVVNELEVKVVTIVEIILEVLEVEVEEEVILVEGGLNVLGVIARIIL